MILKESKTPCCWKSTKLNKQCDRNALAGDHYCLYHKPDKNEFESRVFWKIINWQWKTNRLLQCGHLLYSQDPVEAGKYQDLYQRLRQQEEEENFNDDDRRYEHYTSLRESVKNLYLTRNLGRAGNFRVAFFDGFVFPSGREETFLFRTIDEGDWPIYFRECIFKSGIYFSQYNFTSSVEFRDVKFEQWVIFYHTTFHEKVVFENVYIGCGLANYRIFERTIFKGIFVEFKNFHPHTRLELDKAEFGVGTRLLDTGNDFELDPGTASYGRGFHAIARRVALSNGDLDLAGKHYYQERVFRREEMKIVENEHLLWRCKQQIALLSDWFSAHTCGYGEKPYRAITFSVFIILLFTYCFWIIRNQFISTATSHNISNQPVLDAFFTSTFIFTTIGYGDIKNYTFAEKLLASAEVTIGLIMIAIGTVTLLRKMIR